MRLRGGIGHQPAGIAGVIARALCSLLTGRDERNQRGAGRRILQHATAFAARTKPLGQSAGLGQPVEHTGFHFGTGRTRLPQHALHAQRGTEQFGQHRRPGGIGRKIGEEIGRLPVGQAGDDDAVEVCQHGIKRFG